MPAANALTPARRSRLGAAVLLAGIVASGELHAQRAHSATLQAQPSGLTRPPQIPAIDSLCRRSAPGRGGTFLAGVAGAWTAGLLAWKTLDDPEGSDRRVKGDAGYTPNANTAFAVGSWIGTAVATRLAQPNRASCGSLARALAGAAVPTVPMLFMRRDPYLPMYGVVLFAPLQSIAAQWALP